ncbi:MAG: hypothetical protein IPO05_06085 [Flavobacteriales bacterium]|nr:hypothetical protein [Flavobacteriales bacterium]
MKDFTLQRYELYLRVLKGKFKGSVPFRELLGRGLPSRFCAIRHDVDRRTYRALDMARVEHKLGLVASYYFRVPYTFDVEVIRAIEGLGHEVGYHYENLSETDGDVYKALVDFAEKLEQLRRVATITTCCMHGRPLKPYDNRDLWRDPVRHNLLTERFGMLGELYLDIDYTDIAYITDTGRNWTSGRANRRDHVSSSVPASFGSSEELLAYFENKPHPRLVFQVHPERWTDSRVGHAAQWALDTATNMAKQGVNLLRR